jgi:hypothetical protein
MGTKNDTIIYNVNIVKYLCQLYKQVERQAFLFSPLKLSVKHMIPTLSVRVTFICTSCETDQKSLSFYLFVKLAQVFYYIYIIYYSVVLRKNRVIARRVSSSCSKILIKIRTFRLFVTSFYNSKNIVNIWEWGCHIFMILFGQVYGAKLNVIESWTQ